MVHQNRSAKGHHQNKTDRIKVAKMLKAQITGMIMYMHYAERALKVKAGNYHKQ
jgi:hypothetical protein